MGGEYKLKDKIKIFNINLGNQTCDCKVLQLSGVPCMHVIAYFCDNGLDIFCYIHKSLSKTMYLKICDSIIDPILDQDSWPKVDYDTIMPFQVTKKLSRLKLSRRKVASEDPLPRAYSNKCGKWKQFGHNHRTYQSHSRTHTSIQDEVKCPLVFPLVNFIIFSCFV